MRYDCIIIGTGPAALEAAINLKIREKKFLLIGPEDLSKKLRRAPKINNYLGFPSISGNDLADAFKHHLSTMEITITPERATMVYPMGEYFSVATADNLYESTSMILAPGVFTASPFKGEEEFLGRGVGYCATCDAPLYRGKKVVIVGYSVESQHEANFVRELTDAVYYIPVGEEPTLLRNDITVVKGKVMEISGQMKAEKILLDTGEISADGFFILRESISPSALVPGIGLDGAHIKVDESMATNLPGCFAAGDCVGTPYQYIRAAGQGLTAAHSVIKYLTNH